MTDVPTQQHEGATEIGLKIIARYIPPGTELPDPLPQEVVDAANEIGHNALGVYDNPTTPEEETPVPPGETGPFNLEATIQKALAALPPPKAAPTFMELQKKMQDEMAAQAEPLTPEQEERARLSDQRYVAPPPPPTMAEQVAAMNVEAVELTPEQQAAADVAAQRYVAPPPPPSYIELQEKLQKELEDQKAADLAKLFATPTPPAEPPPTEMAP